MGEAWGSMNSTLLSTIQTTAIAATGLPKRPRFQGPGSKWLSRSRRKMGTPYARYRPTTLTLTMAVKAVCDHKAGMISTSAQAAASHTAFTGVRVRSDTECHQRDPGMAPSREKAKIWRVLLVMLARPQNSMAPIT